MTFLVKFLPIVNPYSPKKLYFKLVSHLLVSHMSYGMPVPGSWAPHPKRTSEFSTSTSTVLATISIRQKTYSMAQ